MLFHLSGISSAENCTISYILTLCFRLLEATIRNMSVRDGGMSQCWQHCSRNRLIKPLNITESKHQPEDEPRQAPLTNRFPWETFSEGATKTDRRRDKTRSPNQAAATLKRWNEENTDESRDERNQDSQCRVRLLDIIDPLRQQFADTHLSTVTARGERGGTRCFHYRWRTCYHWLSLSVLCSGIKYLASSNTISSMFSFFTSEMQM